MCLSSVSVVCASLLLKLYKKPKSKDLATEEYFRFCDSLGDFDDISIHRGMDDSLRTNIRRLTSADDLK